MSLFNSSGFERLQKTKDYQKFENNDDARNIIIGEINNALRQIIIFTPDLEADLYDKDSIREGLLKFCRGNRNAQTQILTGDTSEAIHYGHQLIRLAQQLSSSMQIRIAGDEYKNTGISFIVIDQKSFLFKPDITKHHSFGDHCKYQSAQLLDFFIPAWNQAIQDPQTKRLNI